MITSLEEKKGGTRALSNDARAFNAFTQEVSVVDIKHHNGLFTWTNRQGGDRLIASRLDRFLVSESLLLEGNIMSSEILPSGGSDHWPISLQVSISGTPKNRPFHFE